MFEKRTGEILTDLLIDWRVEHIYGMPGDSINEFVDDLRKVKDYIDFIQIRHEEVGALAASSYAKLTGNLGVCLSIAGPGAVHLLNGLYDAKEDEVPVLAIVGQVTSANVGTNAFQEINLEKLLEEVSVFNRRAESAEQLPDMLNMAIRTAYAEKGVAVLIVPDDLFAVKQNYNKKLTAQGFTKPTKIPDQESIQKAVQLLNQAKKPVILAGRGAKDARSELIEFAEQIKAPVVLSLLGKGILPDYHELNLGQHGQIGTKPAYQAIMEADLLLLIGTSFPYREFLPQDTKAIQLEINAEKIGNIYPITNGLCGDVNEMLPMLTSLLKERTDRSFLNKYQGKMRKWHIQMQKEKKEETNPIQAPQVMYQLETVVEKDAVIACDVGNVTVWTTRFFPFTNQKFLISGKLASMGSGLPGAIASQLAYPEKQVVGICGDGGFTMVMQDFVTAVKYNLPIKLIILNNSKLGMIKYEQEEMGNLHYKTDLGEIDFAAFADACGGDGFRVEKQEELANVMKQAFTSNKATIIDVVIEDQAPLPGKITYDQAITYSQYLIKAFFTNNKVEFPNMKESIRRLM
ncbi:pyruvate oxidase [Virgibacillus oceani]|uniref:Thiamine pyrophosphate-containing protein YdaP n=1 Tax=Virgibacillus oceani TaxID=1479511 RepID=A0A917M0N1_9BACI|nr:pyruvate oxidase [Virgibacillus oceani]GGG70247.1 putative thiamine pyrophosphate-containing protein YdaP [Virgibacillus oceani]